MRDPYDVLGVPKKASAGEIKKAFRKLAKRFHPDQSKEPRAKERFSEANQAYEILGDEKKRAAFDRGEIDAEGKPRFHGFEGFGAGSHPGRGAGQGFEHFEFDLGGGAGPFSRSSRGGTGGFDPSDLFSDLFSGAARKSRSRQPIRGEDVAATVTISLEDAVSGAKARVTLPTRRTLDVSVPPGLEEGKQIRLKGQGMPSASGGEPGDAIVTIRIAKHPLFRVEGRDLRLDLPITLYDAVLGAKVEVPTLSGTVELTIPPGSNGGRTLRLRGKGLPGPGDGVGDLLVTPRIVLPEAGASDLEDLMRRWRDQTPYNPRQNPGGRSSA